jgi:hypothetical protein
MSNVHHPHPSIRPDPEYLKTLPTLAVLTPKVASKAMKKFCSADRFDYRLELKLETHDARYWLITRWSAKGPSVVRRGVVLHESLTANARGQYEMIPYTLAVAKKLQQYDYWLLLRAELMRLLDEPWNWEREKWIQEVETEMDKVIPSATIPVRWRQKPRVSTP